MLTPHGDPSEYAVWVHTFRNALFQFVVLSHTRFFMSGRFVATLLIVGSLFALAGCNTVAGIGDDISGSARTVKRAL